MIRWLGAIITCLVVAKEECEEDVMTVQRFTAQKALSQAARETCGPPVKWPCDNDRVGGFALQQINTNKSDCAGGRGEFDRLDLSSGNYTPLGYVPGICFNGCGISPNNEIYCRERRGGNDGNNLLRVDCPLNMTEVELDLTITPVEGTVCNFGKIPGTYAANFDVNGSFWWKTNDGNKGKIFELTNSSIFDLLPGTVERQTANVPDIISVVEPTKGLQRLADLNVLKLDLGQPNGPGEQDYVIGCWSNLVYFQQVSGDLTGVDPTIVLRMVGEKPGQGAKLSGAQWAFNGSIYCAYNDGTSGVIQVLLNETFFKRNNPNKGTIGVVWVSDSEETDSNDGLNCLKAASPFTTTASTSIAATSATTTTAATTQVAQEACGPPVKWPCGNDRVSSFALQVINTNKSDCAGGRGEFDRLDLSTGNYTPLCYVPGICFNGCGISPNNEIYCRERRGGNDGDNLLRVDCPLNMTEVELDLNITPVEGTVCYFGKIPGTYAANFDVNGSFWWKTNDGNKGKIFELTNSSILDLLPGTVERQTANVPDIISVVEPTKGLQRLADLNALKLDLGQPNGPGEQDYVIGCWSNLVYFQQVSGNLTGVDPIVLEMIGANPGQGAKLSGAQWLFNGKLYCAYNDGTSGVIEVLLNETFFTPNNPNKGQIGVVRKTDSEETNSNDGLNCLNAASPFPPSPPFTTTTTSTTTTATTAAVRIPDPPVQRQRIQSPSTPSPTTTTATAGGGDGDPHIHTLDGQHYLLLSQGSFAFWQFSGVQAETLTAEKFLKKLPVDFQIYTHYSGHQSYTKGLLLLDLSGIHHRAVELTSESCRWRTKTTPEDSWRVVEKPELLSLPNDGDEMTAFNMIGSDGGRKMHVELLMKTQQGFKTIGKLFATCKPGRHMNVKIKMFSPEETRLVKGQLGYHHNSNDVAPASVSLLEMMDGLEGSQQLRTDQEFRVEKNWVQLGGSPDASTYLSEVDGEGPAVFKSCTGQEKDEARVLCQKYLGNAPGDDGEGDVQQQRAIINFRQTLADCIFDVCAGKGETAAELAAEILNAS